MSVEQTVPCPECGASIRSHADSVRLGGVCRGCLIALASGGSISAESRRLPPPPPEAALVDPKLHFGKFIPVEKLGAGATGEVWKSWDTVLGRWVALKVFHEEDSEELARFAREAQTAATLSHPNIAAIYEVGGEGSRRYLSMQFVDGETLQRYPARDRKVLARVIRDAARAIAAAHERGIVHRDLKPANLAVARHGEDPSHPHVYVLDFGLARSVRTADRITASGIVVGTPAYMPPEQARGEAVDGRSDVYSLGATLYELLTRRPLFRGANVYEVLRKVQEQEPRPLRSFNRDIERDLDSIVTRCLEKDPRRRYSSARDLSDDLDRYLDDEPVLARPSSSLRRWARQLAKKKAVVASALIGIVGAALIASLAPGWVRDRALARAQSHLDLARTWIELIDRNQRIDGDRRQETEELADRARKALEAAFSEWPEHADAHFEAGRLHQLLEESTEAMAAFSRAIEINPSLGKARLERAVLGMALYQDQRHDSEGKFLTEDREAAETRRRVLVDLEAARAWSDQVPRLGYLKGLLLLAEAKHSEAARELDAYVNRNPAAWEGWFSRGQALYFSKQPGQAEDSLGKALILKPRDFKTLVFRGRVRFQLKRIEEALKDFVAAAQIDAANSRIRLLVGIAMNELGRHQEAIEELNHALRIDPSNATALAARGRAKAQSGRPLEGLQDIEDAIKLQPEFSSSHHMRGKVLTLLGRPEKAIASLETAIRLNPKDALAHYNLGNAKADLGRWDAAILNYNESINLDDTYPDVYYNRGTTKCQAGRIEEGLLDLNQAITLHPRYAEAYGNRGLCHLLRGRVDEATEDLMKALDFGLKNPEAAYNLACCLLRKGREEEAVRRLEQAVDFGFKNADHMEKDQDLAALRSDPRFIKLLGRLRKSP